MMNLESKGQKQKLQTNVKEMNNLKRESKTMLWSKRYLKKSVKMRDKDMKKSVCRRWKNKKRTNVERPRNKKKQQKWGEKSLLEGIVKEFCLENNKTSTAWLWVLKRQRRKIEKSMLRKNKQRSPSSNKESSSESVKKQPNANVKNLKNKDHLNGKNSNKKV